ncbi:ABC transporter substrate-binding protein [Actinoalloteichus sp. AHMU CJ021]|uniref:Multiple sugar transport system substrate-binding protein n=1 Tax=Actinoalloteichus caeruleus DSM 43889 TaxID=1120930 RepID=A0ABT1JJ43_ACTCY|nr:MULTISPECIES: extracellular solute-binding protein [Actinoalloteichus]AUS78156.1 ABC transporter substrate-binding protein [Actinoalloteichus sp. AHMU CJ021]MCP2332176.1 multiple sugar transport system substrate-binding protein [Actinoalloteichus caeruleus DSM 43889]
MVLDTGWSRRAFLRATLGAAALGAGGATLSGCSSSTTASGATRVRIWSWLTGMDRYVAAFNAAQREVHVELSVIAAGLDGGYAQQTNAIRARNAPDILHVEYQGLIQVLATGGLRDITDDMSDLAEGYSDAAWRGVRPDGRTWAVPMDLAPMVFYYRADLFDRHGIAVPRTWDEFRVAAEAVREADPAARLTTFPLNDGSFFAGMSWQAGQPWWRIDGDTWVVDVDGEGTLRTGSYWQDLISSDLVGSGGTGTQDWIASMHEGRLWGLLGASWSVGTLQKSIPDDTGRWAVTTMPTWGGEPANGMQGGTAFGVSEDSQVPEAAMTFLRWLSTDPEVPRIGATFTSPFPGYLPNREVARDEVGLDYFVGDPVFDVLEEADRRVPEWTWGPNALGLFSNITDSFGGVPAGRTTIPDALRRVQGVALSGLRERGLSARAGGAA